MSKTSTGLSHPRWGGIGAVLTGIGTIVALVVGFLSLRAADSKRTATLYETVITTTGNFSPANLTYLLNGVPLKRVASTTAIVTFNGNSAIMANDFLAPFTVTVPSAYKIVGLYPSQLSSIKTSWQRVSDQQWKMTPQTFNPGEGFGVLLLVADSIENSAASDDAFTNGLSFDWGCRIANVAPLMAVDSYAWRHIDPTALLLSVTGGVFFVFTGIALYSFYLLLILLLLASVLIIRRLKANTSLPFLVIASIIHLVLSILTAEVVVWVTLHGIDMNLPYSWLENSAPVFYIAITWYLLVRNRTKKKGKPKLQEEVSYPQ